MTRAEEAALKAYPIKGKWVGNQYGEWDNDIDGPNRNAFLQGYEQAEKDLAMSYPLPEDTVLFKKGVEEGRRLERDDLALSIDDIEKIHVFLYAVKNNKQGAFTFTRLSDEQYKEVLQRFINIKNEQRIR